jgi:hypothetical protein
MIAAQTLYKNKEGKRKIRHSRNDLGERMGEVSKLL